MTATLRGELVRLAPTATYAERWAAWVTVGWGEWTLTVRQSRTEGGRAEVSRYDVEEEQAETGCGPRSFLVRNRESGDVYGVVCVGGRAVKCTCRGSAHQHCKHRDGVEIIIQGEAT